jgi:predicted PurR-regulated permease PerM
MKQVLKYTGYILLLLIIGYMIWRFSFIIAWVLIAAVLSFIGHPLVRFLDRIHIRKLKMPHSLSALLSLIVIVLGIAGLIAIFVPLILNQADTISRIDVSKLAHNLQGPLQWIDKELHEFGAIPDGQTLQNFLVTKAKSVVNLGNVGSIISSFISVAGNIFIGLFSILFIAFFFLKDENMFEEGLLLFIPLKHHDATRKVVNESKSLLVRYYIGVLL